MDAGDSWEQAMRRAVALSHAVLGSTSPNPPVGAVALDEAGAVVGLGATEPPGGRHAERVALDQAQGRAYTVVSTLEPCNHTGRTGPCALALLDAGVRRVVIACADPTETAGGGVQTLRNAGVEVLTDVLQAEVAAGPLAPWLYVQRAGRPFVTWKYAATLDGRSAALDGTSRWITGEAARSEVHQLRGQVDAVIVGSGTVLADDPELTTRPDPGHQPLRVVVDGRARVPATAKVLDAQAPTLHVTSEQGPVDLAALLKDLAGMGIVHALLEGGPTLAAAFLKADLVDEIRAYLAPALLGSGLSAVGDLGIATIDDTLRLHVTDARRVGDDVRITLRRH